MCVAPCATERSRTVAKRLRYGVQVSGRRNRNSDYPPSLASAELMFGKRDDTSDRVRLRTREDRAANTKCAPRMSHSVFRHRLVAMLCSYNKLPSHTPSSSLSTTTRKDVFLDRRAIENDRGTVSSLSALSSFSSSTSSPYHAQSVDDEYGDRQQHRVSQACFRPQLVERTTSRYVTDTKYRVVPLVTPSDRPFL